jgi:thioredoxin 1
MKNVITLTNENFEKEVLQSDLPVLVDFWAPWCGPCRMMVPVLDALAEDFADKIIISKLDVENSDNQNLAAQYSIQSIPNVKLFYKGKEIANYIGYRDKESFSHELNLVLSKI